MLESSFRMVLLPAPLCPIIPSDSPLSTSKLTSRIAQNSFERCRQSCNLRSSLLGDSRRSASLRIRYFFETPSNFKSNMTLLSHPLNQIGHCGFHMLEI